LKKSVKQEQLKIRVTEDIKQQLESIAIQRGVFRAFLVANLFKICADFCVNEIDLRTASDTKLASLAEIYGLTQRGARGTWIVRKSITDRRTHAERTLNRSTKTSDLRTALLRSGQWIEEFTAEVHGSRLPTLRTSPRWASLENIVAHYLLAATCSPSVRIKNIGQLRAIIGETYPEVEFACLTTEILDGRLVRTWQLARKAAAEKLLPNKEAAEIAKRGANACYRMARSVFSRAMLRSYADAGLSLPAVAAEFATQGFLPAAKPPQAQQLTADNIARLLRVLPRLKTVRPGAWAAILLMWRGGLRNSEVFAARWSWLLPMVNGGYVLRLQTSGEYKPKAGDRLVGLAPDVVAMLDTIRPPADPINPKADPFIVEAPDRHRAVYETPNKVLRACGVATVKNKVAYRLRGHAITEVILANGMDAAQGYAGHSSRTTTAIYQGAAVAYAPLSMPAQSVGKGQ
jgi:integrase